MRRHHTGTKIDRFDFLEFSMGKGNVAHTPSAAQDASADSTTLEGGGMRRPAWTKVSQSSAIHTQIMMAGTPTLAHHRNSATSRFESGSVCNTVCGDFNAAR